ncbi:hypothetical protein J1605_015590 [Eschrichtius robustus]|uniref:Uncharacterized protein n=1 Tax=Eschrichtius robustus TaxID=9764 RepID=A0AB34GAA5_ESCRO|nr:hypothetical protein J1605_015590 [Eschrichtius robustus]
MGEGRTVKEGFVELVAVGLEIQRSAMIPNLLLEEPLAQTSAKEPWTLVVLSIESVKKNLPIWREGWRPRLSLGQPGPTAKYGSGVAALSLFLQVMAMEWPQEPRRSQS